ncbi:hypothetical protein MP228_012584 [Amoeboaphelidium protococcarum]|nr:hypothetical protein MP228_012584 [Amoeboaphelidium protococcarum]
MAEFDQQQQPMQQTGDSGDGTSLYVGNLPWSMRWQELKDMFKPVGDVVYVDIPRSMDNRSKGFGIVRFSNVDDAQKAIQQFNGQEVNGRVLTVREDQQANRRQGGGSRGQGYNNGSGGFQGRGAGEEYGAQKFQVFVGNLPWSVQWQDLKDIAKQKGLDPLRADVAVGFDGKSRGWGTLAFATEDECQKAIQELNGLDMSGRAIEVREDRKR